MSSSAPNFVLVTELQTLTRRDFPLADPTILQPLGANPLLDGEWLDFNTSYQLQRDETGAGGTHEGELPSFPVFTERGRYDTQAIGKSSVLMFGMYEADTQIVNTASLAIGSMLTVQDVTISALTKRGLAKVVATSGSGVVVVGYVTKLYAGLTKVRFMHTGYQTLV
jgi:hypothetical protein